jgi:hypothetical protein
MWCKPLEYQRSALCSCDLDENIEGARQRGLIAVLVTSTDDVARALDALGI